MDEIDAALDFKNVSIVACYIYVRICPQAARLNAFILKNCCAIHSLFWKVALNFWVFKM